MPEEKKPKEEKLIDLSVEEKREELGRVFREELRRTQDWQIDEMYAYFKNREIDKLKVLEELDLNNTALKDPKNHVDATLSGTAKIVEIDREGTPYYFKIYPTKT